MAPMARTNRNSSLNDLDDLDLDDMFEGGQDGLFDQLGMDMGELGDITSSDPTPSSGPSAPPVVPKNLDDMKFDLLGDIGVDDGATSPVQKEQQESSSLKKSRRKTKRKAKGTTASHVEEEEQQQQEEEEEPSRKKRRTKKSKGISKKTKLIEAEPSATSTTKSKVKAKASIMPSVERSSSSTVAATGTLGSRQKRGNYPLQTRPTNKAKAKSSTSGVVPASASVTSITKSGKPVETAPQLVTTAKRNRSVPEVSRPLETLFCGLHPSDRTFYPFLSLPTETSMKRCNKQYPILDRINAALAPTTPGPEMNDTLLRLLMFHDQAQTKEKKLLMSASVMTSRKVFNTLDRQLLGADLRSVATLVKRQHDFLAQSLGNMERWCKKNFSEEDYRAVYGGEQIKSIFTQLSSPIVRVKIRFSGFKEPKPYSPLIAHLPHSGMKACPQLPPVQTRKKRPETSTNVGKPTIEEPVLEYADLSPDARRGRITNLITNHALSLEACQNENNESRRKTLEKQHQMLQKVVDNDDLIQLNTMTLWKWIDKARYYSDFTKKDIQDSMMFQPEANDHGWQLRKQDNKIKDLRYSRESLSDRLHALLVDINSDGEDGEDIDDEWDDENDIESSWGETNNEAKGTDSAILDISSLTIEERTYLYLRSSGLIDESFPLPNSPSNKSQEETDEDGDENVVAVTDLVEFENLIQKMKSDVSSMDQLNNSRMRFMKYSANIHLTTMEKTKQEEEHNSQLISKYNHLMKRQKETKRSVRHKVQKKDEDWVPW